jgi:hypothetical protein
MASWFLNFNLKLIMLMGNPLANFAEVICNLLANLHEVARDIGNDFTTLLNGIGCSRQIQN